MRCFLDKISMSHEEDNLKEKNSLLLDFCFNTYDGGLVTRHCEQRDRTCQEPRKDWRWSEGSDEHAT